MRADGESRDVDTAGGDVLGEVAGAHIQARGRHLVDGLLGEQAHLTVPGTRVGVALDAVLGAQEDLGEPPSCARPWTR